MSANKHAAMHCAHKTDNPNKVKDTIYDDLDIIISAIPHTIKLFLLGDLNASVGTDHQTLEGVMGLGVGK